MHQIHLSLFHPLSYMMRPLLRRSHPFQRELEGKQLHVQHVYVSGANNELLHHILWFGGSVSTPLHHLPRWRDLFHRSNQFQRKSTNLQGRRRLYPSHLNQYFLRNHTHVSRCLMLLHGVLRRRLIRSPMFLRPQMSCPN